MKLLALLLLVFSACDVTPVPVPSPSVSPEPSPSPSASPSPSPSPEPSGIILNCQNVTFNFTGVLNAKTYLLFDTLSNGQFASTGTGGNGNIGNSAQQGASCCRPDADPSITGLIPDNGAHTLGVYALNSDGYFLPGNPIIKYNVLASERTDCQESYP